MEDIIVCVKQVPNTTKVKLDPVNHTILREGVESIINPFDDFALEEALFLKKKFNLKVSALTMGPNQALEVLNYCLSKGADEAYLLTDKKLAGSDTLATARSLAALIKKLGYKVIFCGQESIDSSTGHIGPSIGEFLNIPQVTHIEKILNYENEVVKVKEKNEFGYNIIKVKLPAIFSFLKSKKKLKRGIYSKDTKNIKVFSLKDIDIDENLVGLMGSPTRVVKIDVDDTIDYFLKVDSNLTAIERIKIILKGGIEEKKDRLVYKEINNTIISKLIQIIK